MSLLKLTPDSERLRRFARAHAAGEMSTPEYRRARALVIENFDAEAANDATDDTERRWRPELVPAVASRAAAEPTRSPTVAIDDRARRWRTTIAFAILLGIFVFGVGQAWAVTIEPVRDRDPNPATSQRIAVTRIALSDFAVSAAGGIDEADVNAFLAARLAAVVASTAPRPHGFNARELDELGHLLTALGAGERALSAADAKQISELVARQRATRGVSVVELESIAADLTTFYRERGLPLAVAYVPAQEVVNGEVKFAVQVGVLESVAISGEGRYSQKLLARAFESQIGAPVVRSDISAALYRVNELPGLETRATFRPGTEVGGTRLELTAIEEPRFAGHVRVDNHGVDATGNERLVMHGDWFNPSGRGDHLAADLLASVNPTNTLFGGLAYEAPLADLSTRGIARLGVNAFDWESAGLETEGRVNSFSVGARHDLERSRRHSTGLDGLLTAQTLELEAADGTDLVDQDLLMLGVGYDRVDRFDAAALSTDARAQFDIGRVLDGELDGQDDTFYRLSVAASAWRLIDLVGFDSPQRIGVSVRGQWANTALPGTMQLSLGGPGRVGSLDYGTLSVDSGAVASLVLRLREWEARFGDFLLFVDAGYGEQERIFGESGSVHASSMGAGWLMDFDPHWTAELKASVPTGASHSPAVNDRGFNLFWMVRYVP